MFHIKFFCNIMYKKKIFEKNKLKKRQPILNTMCTIRRTYNQIFSYFNNNNKKKSLFEFHYCF